MARSPAGKTSEETPPSPRITEARRVLSDYNRCHRFTPGGKLLVIAGARSLLALDPAGKDGPAPFLDFDYLADSVYPFDDELTLLAAERMADDPACGSSSDPYRLWWVEGGTKRLLWDAESDMSPADSPISPDGRLVAISRLRDKPGKDAFGCYTLVTLIDRTTGRSRDLDLCGRSLDLIGWHGQGAGLRAVVVANHAGDRDEGKREVFLADPATGDLESAPRTLPLRHRHVLVSPSGQRIARYRNSQLELTGPGKGNGKIVPFTPAEEEYTHFECMRWLNDRYIQLHGRQLTLIDAETAVKHYPLRDGRPVESYTSSYEVSPDLRWVAFRPSGKALHLGRLVFDGGR